MHLAYNYSLWARGLNKQFSRSVARLPYAVCVISAYQRPVAEGARSSISIHGHRDLSFGVKKRTQFKSGFFFFRLKREHYNSSLDVVRQHEAVVLGLSADQLPAAATAEVRRRSQKYIKHDLSPSSFAWSSTEMPC